MRKLDFSFTALKKPPALDGVQQILFCRIYIPPFDRSPSLRRYSFCPFHSSTLWGWMWAVVKMQTIQCSPRLIDVAKRMRMKYSITICTFVDFAQWMQLRPTWPGVKMKLSRQRYWHQCWRHKRPPHSPWWRGVQVGEPVLILGPQQITRPRVSRKNFM